MERLRHFLPSGGPPALVLGSFCQLLHLMGHAGVIMSQVHELAVDILHLMLEHVHESQARLHHLNLLHGCSQELNLGESAPECVFDV